MTGYASANEGTGVALIIWRPHRVIGRLVAVFD